MRRRQDGIRVEVECERTYLCLANSTFLARLSRTQTGVLYRSQEYTSLRIQRPRNTRTSYATEGVCGRNVGGTRQDFVADRKMLYIEWRLEKGRKRTAGREVSLRLLLGEDERLMMLTVIEVSV